MYKHTQIGYVVILAVVAVMLGILAKVVFQGPSGFDWKLHAIVGIAILLVGVMFSSLTIEVEPAQVSWQFGIPAIKNAVRMEDILNVAVVRNPFIYGWGAHMIPRGWVYNVSGRDAVELTLRDGSRVRLGTDQPDVLLSAITSCCVPQFVRQIG